MIVPISRVELKREQQKVGLFNWSTKLPVINILLL